MKDQIKQVPKTSRLFPHVNYENQLCFAGGGFSYTVDSDKKSKKKVEFSIKLPNQQDQYLKCHIPLGKIRNSLIYSIYNQLYLVQDGTYQLKYTLNTEIEQQNCGGTQNIVILRDFFLDARNGLRTLNAQELIPASQNLTYFNMCGQLFAYNQNLYEITLDDLQLHQYQLKANQTQILKNVKILQLTPPFIIFKDKNSMQAYNVFTQQTHEMSCEPVDIVSALGFVADPSMFKMFKYSDAQIGEFYELMRQKYAISPVLLELFDDFKVSKLDLDPQVLMVRLDVMNSKWTNFELVLPIIQRHLSIFVQLIRSELQIIYFLRCIMQSEQTLNQYLLLSFENKIEHKLVFDLACSMGLTSNLVKIALSFQNPFCAQKLLEFSLLGLVHLSNPQILSLIQVLRKTKEHPLIFQKLAQLTLSSQPLKSSLKLNHLENERFHYQHRLNQERDELNFQQFLLLQKPTLIDNNSDQFKMRTKLGFSSLQLALITEDPELMSLFLNQTGQRTNKSRTCLMLFCKHLKQFRIKPLVNVMREIAIVEAGMIDENRICALQYMLQNSLYEMQELRECAFVQILVEKEIKLVQWTRTLFSSFLMLSEHITSKFVNNIQFIEKISVVDHILTAPTERDVKPLLQHINKDQLLQFRFEPQNTNTICYAHRLEIMLEFLPDVFITRNQHINQLVTTNKESFSIHAETLSNITHSLLGFNAQQLCETILKEGDHKDYFGKGLLLTPKKGKDIFGRPLNEIARMARESKQNWKKWPTIWE
ncbi:Hypothetical_protein [Hexamita inflata]|uniref:Hypothetical_protein n=1 Tax=Hexamita inflata TaxID=28002 RepID=A0AA86QVC8_9EUKA|nr:Hypothetical protein HINF_LOCUS45895 [Hexamita inflata]